MNIALISMEIHKHGGVPLCMAYLLEHLRSHHKITVFSNLVDDIDTVGISIYRIPAPSRPRFLRPIVFIFLLNILFLWLRLFRRVKFDIVHSAGEEGALTANIVTSHFCQRKELDALHKGVVALPTQTWQQRVQALDYHINRRLACFLEWLVFGRNNRRLRTAVSRRMKDDFRHYYGSPAEAIMVIPNGVDVQEFHPRLRAECRSKIRREHGLADSDFVLFFIGGDWERKGVPQAIETLAHVPDPRVKLLIVGMGDEAHYHGVAEKYGVGARVSFCIRFVRQAHYYAASDVFLFPTLYEPFGLVILEAMATGMPVITSAIAGAADCIEDGVDSLLVSDPRDVRQLADKVNALSKDANMCRSMGERARRKAETLSWQNIIARYEAAYQSLIETRRNITTCRGSLP